MKSKTKNKLPLVYSCSGCSNIAQLANQIAVDMDREQHAEMSCIAGLGGDVKSLVKKAQSADKIIALDGCQLNCVKNTLSRHGIKPTWHFTLTDYELKKRYHEDFREEDLQQVKAQLIENISKQKST